MRWSEAHLVRHHHERGDGTGYPDGLAREETPLGSRLIHVADAMDAILMPRCYKEAYPVERMVDQISRCAGSQFDPALAVHAVQWVHLHVGDLILPGTEARR